MPARVGDKFKKAREGVSRNWGEAKCESNCGMQSYRC